MKSIIINLSNHSLLLFLEVFCLFFCLLSCFLLTLAFVSLIDPELSDLFESFECLHFFGNCLSLLSQYFLWFLNHMLVKVLLLSLSRFQSIGRRIRNLTFFVSCLSGEKNHWILIWGKSLYIELKSFLWGILSSMINSNTDALGKRSSETSLFNFLKSKSSTISKFCIISPCSTMHYGSQSFQGSWEYSTSLFLSCHCSSVFTSRLIEPCLEEPLSVFSQMDVWKNVIMLDHLSN